MGTGGEVGEGSEVDEGSEVGEGNDCVSAESSPVLNVIRAILLGTLVFGLVGIGFELLLLEHTEDVWQWIPIALVAVSLVVLGWHLVSRGRASLRAHQGVMMLFVVSGIVGSVLHYKGNVEFELEMNSALRGFELVGKTMMGATPVLAPGTMIQLGLIGLAYAFRHPALQRAAGDQPHSTR